MPRLPSLDWKSVQSYAEQIAKDSKDGKPFTSFSRFADRPEYSLLVTTLSARVTGAESAAIQMMNILAIVERQVEENGFEDDIKR